MCDYIVCDCYYIAPRDPCVNLTECAKRCLESGDTPKARVHEIVNIKHPARFFTRPDQTAYALVAIDTIKVKEPCNTRLKSLLYKKFDMCATVCLIARSFRTDSFVPHYVVMYY